MPNSEARKLETGRSVMSYRIVPSLNVETLCFALRIPFSIGSGVLFLEVSAFTPFRISNALSLSFTISNASL